MPRPKSYDRHDAVEAACKAFWAHGYQALGVRELEKLTGLNQFAIRTEFGGKEGLYKEALTLYCEAAITNAMAPMNEGGLEEITTFMTDLVRETSMTCSPWGCLIVNTGVENARIGSADLDQAVRDYWASLEQHFLQALANACERGEIAEALDLRHFAKGLVTAVMGVHAANRAKKSHEGGQELVHLIVNYLQSLRVNA